MKFTKPLKLFALVYLLSMVSAQAQAQDFITNPSFEYGWSGWVDVDPDKNATSISGHAFSGEKSAKISRETGSFEQEIELHPDSDYVLRALIKGPGQVGIRLDQQTLTAESPGDGETWLALEIPFSSTVLESGVVFGAANGGEGRFDDFQVVAISGEALAAAQQAAAGPPVYATIPGGCDRLSQLRIKTASDDGSNDGHTPEMAIDADFRPDSRWSSELVGKELILDMRVPQTLKEIGLAWYKGDARRSSFSIETSVNGTDWSVLVDKTRSSGLSTTIERIDFDDRIAKLIKIIGYGNESNAWNSLVEVQAYGCGLGEIESQGDGTQVASAAKLSSFGFDTTATPAENFDLTRWKITLPIDADKDGRADEINEGQLAKGWADKQMFYTDPVTGGMVFRTVGGDATTPGSKYPRTELREMLRAGDDSISTRGDGDLGGANNWVFSSAPAEAQSSAGGIDGELVGKLMVNQVTRMGDPSQVGRVIIGQIHAREGEPIRLYYRKLPTNKYGSVYYIHELEGREDVYVPLIGGREDRLANPDDGIAIDEVFGYRIAVSGTEINGKVHPILSVSITRDDGSVTTAAPLDMADSGYDVAGEFMFFKAGAYSQNNTTPWPDRDFDQITFLELAAGH